MHPRAWPCPKQLHSLPRPRPLSGHIERRISQDPGLAYVLPLEGQGALVSRLITTIIHIITLVILIVKLLAESP